jgi:vacuolar protein-sorting-associated protein 4
MNNTFIPQAVDIVKQAIDYDNLGEYEKALQLYQKAREYFITGLKYEQNPASKKIISDKVVGYMNRAEEIKKSLADAANGKSPGGSGGGSKTMSRDEKGKEDDEKSKLRGALSSSIVSEKPNVKWDDVAGLEGAKEALKEGKIEIYLT